MTEWRMIAPDSLDNGHLLVTAVRCVPEKEDYAACCRDLINAMLALKTKREGARVELTSGLRRSEPFGFRPKKWEGEVRAG
jgi:hypothetical protein